MTVSPAATLIQGAAIVDASGVGEPTDLRIEHGMIQAIGADASRIAREADRVIDATGSLLLPGGIDPHVHFQTPSDGTVTTDTFETGSVAAAFGGVTTALQFCVQDRGERLTDTVDRWTAALEQTGVHVDVGFHVMVTDLDDPARFDELRRLPERGVTSFKVFMSGENAIGGANLFKTMQIAREVGARVMVHAEDGASIGVMTEQALAAGRRHPREHAATRPVPTEAIAVYRAIEYARMTGAEVYFVHLSSAAAIGHVREARRQGLTVDGETCPHYVLFDESILASSYETAAPYLFTPPPRTSADHEAIWAALSDGTLSTVASDHGGYCLHEKTGAADFTRIPQGIIGIETRLAFLHHYGVRAGKLSVPRLAELTSTRPAELFGLGTRKGRIQVGYDADLVVFDPAREQVISQATHHSAHDYNPFEGYRVVGQVTHTLVRGELVVDDGRLAPERPVGRLVARDGLGGDIHHVPAAVGGRPIERKP